MTFASRLGLFQVEVVSSRSGMPTLRAGEKTYLSPYDPVKEAARRASALHGEKKHLVGLGLGYLAEALGERLKRILVFEGEEARYSKARGRDLTNIFPPEKIVRARCLADLCLFLDEALRAEEEIVLDPALGAAPRLRARLLDYQAYFDVESGSSDPALLEEPADSLPSGPELDSLLFHQSRHGFTAYPAFDFEFVEAPRDPKRILVIQPSSIGDVLYFTPALRALRALHPAARIVYLVEREAAEVVRGLVDRVLVARRTDWLEGDEGSRESLARLVAEIGKEDFDLVINPHQTARCAWYATLAAQRGAAILGAHFHSGRPVLSGDIHHLRWIHALRERITPHPAPGFFAFPSGFPMRLTVAADLARRAGAGRCEPRIGLAIGARRRQRVESFLGETVSKDARFLVAVHTGSNASIRRYRRDRWPIVCDGLARDFGARVVLIGGPADVERNAWIRARCAAPPLDATGAGGLGFTAALLERCALLVGPETSTVHLAASVACPTLTITGRVKTGWSGAFAPRSLVLHGPADPPWCRLLAPETVLRAAGFVLGKTDLGEIPVDFGVSWTGAKAPNEFFREMHPVRNFSAAEYHDHLLALAWENLLSMINESWGYPSGQANAAAVRDWLGPVPDGTEALVRASIRSLENPDAFGGAFHAPLAHCRSTAAESLRSVRDFLEAAIV